MLRFICMFMVACTPWSIEQLERVLQRLHHAPSERDENSTQDRPARRNGAFPVEEADDIS